MSVALNFQQTGNLDAPAVVLLGSLGSDLSMWQPQIHALSNRYRVIAVDHRGHGKSDGKRTYVKSYVDYQRALMPTPTLGSAELKQAL